MPCTFFFFLTSDFETVLPIGCVKDREGNRVFCQNVGALPWSRLKESTGGCSVQGSVPKGPLKRLVHLATPRVRLPTNEQRMNGVSIIKKKRRGTGSF